jgi:hypothetical protein
MKLKSRRVNEKNLVSCMQGNIYIMAITTMEIDGANARSMLGKNIYTVWLSALNNQHIGL